MYKNKNPQLCRQFQLLQRKKCTDIFQHNAQMFKLKTLWLKHANAEPYPDYKNKQWKEVNVVDIIYREVKVRVQILRVSQVFSAQPGKWHDSSKDSIQKSLLFIDWSLATHAGPTQYAQIKPTVSDIFLGCLVKQLSFREQKPDIPCQFNSTWDPSWWKRMGPICISSLKDSGCPGAPVAKEVCFFKLCS